jgi:hypothetical protein
VARNESGSSYGIATFGGSALFGSISFTSTQMGAAATIAALISATGTFINQMNSVGQALNTIGSSINYVSNQISYNNDKSSRLLPSRPPDEHSTAVRAAESAIRPRAEA